MTLLVTRYATRRADEYLLGVPHELIAQFAVGGHVNEVGAKAVAVVQLNEIRDID